MRAMDRGKGKDSVGTVAGVGVQDRAGHRTAWRIDRYDESVFERKVRPLMKRVSEALLLAEGWKRAKNFADELRCRELAERLIAEVEAYAFDATCFEGNLLLNEGIDEIWDIVTGTGTPTDYDNTNARLGVGNSSTVADATQTGLQGASSLFKGMEAGYPTASTQKATWKSVFGSSEANFAWEEFSVDNGATADKNLNRKVSSQGTKTSGQTWTLTLDITLS